MKKEEQKQEKNRPSVKQQVLALLEERKDSYISGEEIAEQLLVTRSAVWKAIKQLKESGHEIEAVTNRGYRLKQESDMISEAGIRKNLKTRTMGANMIVLEETDSTNNVVKQLAAQGATEGTTVIADHQTAGKGRLGRSFFSPGRKGIYVSILLRPQIDVQKSVLITSMAAAATARAIERMSGIEAKIKWVNDIFLNGRKTCGILTEAGIDFESGHLEYAVLGIGINVGEMEFPEELKEIATSVSNECGKSISRNELLAVLLNEIDILYGDLESGAFLEENRRRSILLGKEIKVLTADGSYPAMAVDIDELGGLIVETKDGRRTLNSGEVSVRL